MPLSAPQQLVTVIVPMFNVEAYLEECLASIEAQTLFEHCEIVVIDDGSTDGSGRIAAEFAARHPNVVLRTQENRGLGAARNTAMDLATGRYVMFCDSDDILPPRAVAALYAAVTAQPGVPIAVGLQRTFPSETKWAWTEEFGKGSRIVGGIAEAPTLTHSAGACNKIFALDFIREHKLRFKEGVHFEDVWFVLPALAHAPRIALVNEEVYLYRRRAGGGSIMDTTFSKQGNYWDHLAANLNVAELRDQLDVLKQEALNLFIARSYQVFASRAYRMFDGAELRLLFEGAKRLYGGIPLATILRAVTEGHRRVGVLACLMDDFDLFSRPHELVTSVRARGGELYIDYPVPASLLPLAKITSISARIDQIRPSDDGSQVELSGRFDMNGLRLANPLGNTMNLVVRGTGVSVSAEGQRRTDLQDPDGEGLWAGFTATVPTDALPSGRHGIKLEWHTDSGTVSRIAMITTAGLRQSRTVVLPDGGRLLPTWTRGDRFVLEVLRGKRTQGATARAWRRKLSRRDLVHIALRRPYWKARLLRIVTRPLIRDRDIWLIGERRDTVQDNSGHLFRHMRTVEKRRDVYYVIAKGSPDVKRLDGLGNIVWHGSLRHMILLLHATKLINSYDIDAYMLPESWSRLNYLKHVAWRNGARRIWLQHGVVDQDVSLGAHAAKSGVDLMVTTTGPETEFVRDWMGYRERAVPLGLPRFDALVPDHGRRRLLVATTWRSTLVSPSYNSRIAAKASFEGSAYQRFLQELFDDRRLRDALVKHGFTLEFLPHYEMRELAPGMMPADGPYELVDLSKRTFQEALRGCDLFVTDWSSTHFDVSYMGTPVIYAQFDPEEFWNTQARIGYFDYRRDGFGPVCETVEQTVDAIIHQLENGCVRDELYAKRAAQTLPERDGLCCARVSAAIAALSIPADSPAAAHRNTGS